MKRPHYRGNRPQRRPFKNQADTDVVAEDQNADMQAAPESESAPQEQEAQSRPAPAGADAPLETRPVAEGEQRQGRDGGQQRGDNQRGDNQRGDNRDRDNRERDNRGDRNFRRNRHQRGRQNRDQRRGGQQGGQQQQREREDTAPADAPMTAITGILDVRKDNTALLRRVSTVEGGESTGDAFIGAGLRPNDYRPGVVVTAEAVASTGRSPWVVRKIVAIDGEPPENARNVAPFERGTVIDPVEWLKLETGKEPIGTRVLDLFCPIGKGTRGMIVAPPRSGKTILLKQIAQAIVKNHPDCKLIIMLVDERPEEVTDFKRSIPEAEVWASSNDESVQSHLDMARLVINRSKRMVERGKHVVMLLDSLTRLARAFNAAGEGAKGRTMSGGMAAGAMQEPRAIFGASRCLEEGGSLTIIATALVETGSAMDELIFQEFKGTGNMELVLERKLAEKRLFPAIDISASGTRKDEKLQDPATHKRVGIIRRYLSGMDMVTGMTRLLEVMEKTDSNAEVLKKFEP